MDGEELQTLAADLGGGVDRDTPGYQLSDSSSSESGSSSASSGEEEEEDQGSEADEPGNDRDGDQNPPAPVFAKEVPGLLGKAIANLQLRIPNPTQVRTPKGLGERFSRVASKQVVILPVMPHFTEHLEFSWNEPLSAAVPISMLQPVSKVDGLQALIDQGAPPIEEIVVDFLEPKSSTSEGKTVKFQDPARELTRELSNKSLRLHAQSAASASSLAILLGSMEKIITAAASTGLRPAACQDLLVTLTNGMQILGGMGQAAGAGIASMVVLQRHLWLQLTTLSKSKKSRLTKAKVGREGLFGPNLQSCLDRHSKLKEEREALEELMPKAKPPTASSKAGTNNTAKAKGAKARESGATRRAKAKKRAAETATGAAASGGGSGAANAGNANPGGSGSQGGKPYAKKFKPGQGKKK